MGTAAKGTTLADSILKLRSGIHASANHLGFASQFRKKSTHFCPDFSSAGEAAPVGPNQADKLVALVHRGNVILRFSQSVSMANTIDEEGFDIRFKLMENGIVFGNFCPGIKWQQGFNRSGRAGVEG